MLLDARGEDLGRLLEVASGCATAGLESAGRPGVVTYSPKVFVPLTRLCRDRCHYCTFVTVPGRLAAAAAVPHAGRGARDRAGRARGRLPGGPVHPGRPAGGALAGGARVAGGPRLRLDAGVRARDGRAGPGGDRAAAAPEPRRDELGRAEPAQAGRAVDGDDARDDVAAAVRRAVRGALRLARTRTRRSGCGCWRMPAGCSIPFTTGILVGIGETVRERADSLLALRTTARRHGHVQEVIVQNFRAKDDTAMQAVPDLDHEEYLATLAIARLVLGAGRAAAGAAQPVRAARAAGPARRRRRRLGRGLAGDRRPRQPRAAVAAPGRPAGRHGRGRLRRCARG